jgi:translation initiation factor 3 subunit C
MISDKNYGVAVFEFEYLNIKKKLYFLAVAYYMSRFFRPAGDSDSDSEESDEELLTSGDEDAPPSKPGPSSKPALSRFLKTAGKDSSSSSESSDEDEDNDFSRDQASGSETSDDEVKRVIKSAQDKRLEAMEATGKVMDNALKINDWVAISNGQCWYMYQYSY